MLTRRSTVEKTSDPLRFAVAAVLVASLAAGCRSTVPENASITQALDVREKIGLKKEVEPPPPEIPSRLVATWVHAVRHTPGQTPERGFGGRIVFFGRDMDQPVRVDGQLVVYAFDESDREEYETQPDKRFIFPADQFVLHEGESSLGPSYSVWIPWDKVGGTRKNISLITRFEPAGGPIVVGEQTRHLLPGLAEEIAQAPIEAAQQQSILQASHAQSTSPAAPSGATQALAEATMLTPNQTQQLSTAKMTVELPDSMKARLKRRLQQMRAQNNTQHDSRNPTGANTFSSAPAALPAALTPPVQPTSQPENAQQATAGNEQTSAPLATHVGASVRSVPARGLSASALR